MPNVTSIKSEPEQTMPPELAEALARWFFDGVERSRDPGVLLYRRLDALIAIIRGLQAAVLAGLEVATAAANGGSVTAAVLEARNQLLRSRDNL
jgi:hypothetical protein